ncbi:tetratricopeptide repeat protein [Sorangium sp. So ce362]|uniref:tetratricopeptide repeat protein n=1 Tax=Sorangium sp. So ce362 TaxID=3133303 RepID=UPI003F64594B
MALVSTADAGDVEAAFRDFLGNDVTVEAFGAAASRRRLLGEAPLSRTVHVALSGEGQDARAAADALAEAVVPWGSFVLLQGLVGTAFTRQGRYDDALRVHLTALRLTPRWHPTSVYRVLDAIADDLVHLGRFDEAARLAERALEWDPTNPDALLTLGVALARAGDRGRAGGVLAYLASSGYSEVFLRALIGALGGDRAKAQPYAPDLAKIPALSDDAWLRFCAVNALNPFAEGEEQRRAHAVACLARGHHDYALFATRQAPKWVTEDSPIDGRVARAWAKAREEAIVALDAARGVVEALAREEDGQFGEESEVRFQFADACVERGDAGPLLAMLLDPSREVVLYAARALVKLGRTEHAPLIEAMAAGERALGWDDLPSAVKVLSAMKRAGGGAKKKPAPAKGKAARLRGRALVAKVIEAIAGTDAIADPRPVPAAKLKKLTFPCKKPLSPGLAAFLAFDASFLGLFEDPEAPRFAPRTLRQIAEAEFDPMLAGMFEGIEEALPGEAYLLGAQDGEARDVLYVGEPDAAGEYPVLEMRVDPPGVRVAYPGVDVYLAHLFEVVLFDPDANPEDARALEAHSKLDLSGWSAPPE